MRELEAQANSVRSKLMQGAQAEAQGTGVETAPQGMVVEAGEDKPDAPNARELGDADAGTLKAASDDGDGRKADDSEGAAATDADATPSRSADAAAKDRPDASNARELGDADAGTLKAASDDRDRRKAEIGRAHV